MYLTYRLVCSRTVSTTLATSLRTATCSTLRMASNGSKTPSSPPDDAGTPSRREVDMLLRPGTATQRLAASQKRNLVAHRTTDDGTNAMAPPPLPPAQQREFEQLQRAAMRTAAELGHHPDASTSPTPSPAFPNATNPTTGEIGGPRGKEPTRYGDWEVNGRVYDF